MVSQAAATPPPQGPSGPHDAVRDVVGQWLTEQGCQVQWEQIVPYAAARNEARLDLVARVPGWAAPTYIDVTVVSAAADEPLSRGSATRPGVAADLAERKKERDYPGIPVLAVAVEEHGRLGDKARSS